MLEAYNSRQEFQARLKLEEMSKLYTPIQHANEMQDYEACMKTIEFKDVEFMQKMEDIAQEVRDYISDPSNKLNNPKYYEKTKQLIWDMNKHWDVQVKESTAKIQKQLLKCESVKFDLNEMK